MRSRSGSGADDGARHALRVLVAARDQMAVEKTMNINALTALLRTNDLGIDARQSLTMQQIGEKRMGGTEPTRDPTLRQALPRAAPLPHAQRSLRLE